MKTGRGHNESRLHGIRKACARRSKIVVAADAAVVDSVATTASPFGATVTDFVNDGITLAIRGPLPRGAYIRWYYDVKNPNVRFDTTANAWAYTGEAVVKRHSNYHRTDKPCAMEARRSRYTYQQDVLDTLPFSVSDIALHRAELCDYCFYGGPAGLRPSL
jgi:hypothetical protein